MVLHYRGVLTNTFKMKLTCDRPRGPRPGGLRVVFLVCLGTNRISYAIQGAHEGGIFALCMLRDGTLVSGGGKDRKLISWNGNYQKLHKTEVRQQAALLKFVSNLKLLPQSVSLLA